MDDNTGLVPFSGPVPYFKDGHEPKYPLSLKEQQALVADGWSRTYAFREFPKRLYKGGVSELVHNAADEQRLLHEGYGHVPTAKPESPKAKTESAAATPSESAGRLDVIENRLDKIEELLAERPKIKKAK